MNESILSGPWILVIIIVLLLFGGGIFDRGGGNGGASVEAAVQNAINAQSTQAGLKEILLSSANNNYETAMLISNQNLLNAQQRSADQVNVIQGFNAIQQALAGLSSQLSSCCCELRSTLLKDKYDAAVRELTKVQTENATKAQSEYLLSVMGKWVANPAAAAA